MTPTRGGRTVERGEEGSGAWSEGATAWTVLHLNERKKKKKKRTLPTLHCFHVRSQLTVARLPVMFPALASAPLLLSNCFRFPSSFSFPCQVTVTSHLYPCSHVPPARPSSLLHRFPFTNSPVVITAHFPFPSFLPFLSNTSVLSCPVRS